MNGNHSTTLISAGHAVSRGTCENHVAVIATATRTNRIQIEGRTAMRVRSPLMTASVPSETQIEIAAKHARIDAAIRERRP